MYWCFLVASYISRIEIQPRPTLSKDYKHNVFCPISRGNTVVFEEAMERVFNGKESKPHRNPSDLLWLICAAMIRGWSVGRVRAAPALSWAPGAYRWLRPTTRDFRTGDSSTECTNQRIGSRLHQGRITLIYYSSVYRRFGSGVAWTFVSGPFLYFFSCCN